jgi:hypothetical protein
MDRGDHLSAGRDHLQADEVVRHTPQNFAAFERSGSGFFSVKTLKFIGAG